MGYPWGVFDWGLYKILEAGGTLIPLTTTYIIVTRKIVFLVKNLSSIFIKNLRFEIIRFDLFLFFIR